MLDLTRDQFMESPFSEEDPLPESEKLGQFLRYARRQSQPFEAEFITSLLNFSRYVATCRSTPGTLLDSFEAVSQLDLIIDLMQAERHRLTKIYRDYISQQGQVLAEYSREKIDQWLKENPITATNQATT